MTRPAQYVKGSDEDPSLKGTDILKGQPEGTVDKVSNKCGWCLEDITTAFEVFSVNDIHVHKDFFSVDFVKVHIDCITHVLKDPISVELWNNLQVVTLAQKQTLVDRFHKHMSLEADLLICGSCGIRDFNNITEIPDMHYKDDIATNQDSQIRFTETHKFVQKKVEDLTALEFTDKCQQEYDNEHIQYKTMRSVYISINNQHYHLHPEAIDDNEHVHICIKCWNDIKNKVVPTFNVKNIDYGIISRIPKKHPQLKLDPLTLPELLLLQKFRVYGINIHVTTRGDSQTIQGHAIAFPQVTFLKMKIREKQDI